MTTEEKTELLKDVARLAPKEWDAHTRVSELRLYLGGHICDVGYNEITNAFLTVALLKWLGEDYSLNWSPIHNREVRGYDDPDGWCCEWWPEEAEEDVEKSAQYFDPEPVYAVLLAVRERLKEMEG